MKNSIVQRFKAAETRIQQLEEDLLVISRATKTLLDAHPKLKKVVKKTGNP